MTDTFTVEVLHTVEPEALDEAELQPALRDLADSRYVVVGRKGGRQSWLDRLRAFVARDPVEAVTLVADEAVNGGAGLNLRLQGDAVGGG